MARTILGLKAAKNHGVFQLLTRYMEISGHDSPLRQHVYGRIGSPQREHSPCGRGQILAALFRVKAKVADSLGENPLSRELLLHLTSTYSSR